MNIFQRFFASLRYREAVKLANEHHAKDGGRYYIMPMLGGGHKLVVVDRRNFHILKRKKYIDSTATIQQLEYGCFYHTPYLNGSGAITEIEQLRRYQLYLAWWENERKNKRKAKHTDK